jgi:hypothetical protein
LELVDSWVVEKTPDSAPSQIFLQKRCQLVNSRIFEVGDAEPRFLPNVPAQTPTTGASVDTHINHQTT